MDRLHDISAAGTPVVIGGKTYFAQPLKTEHWGEAELYALSRNPSPLKAVIPRLAELPEPLQKLLLEAAYRDETQGRWMTKDDVLRYLTTNALGMVFAFWCWIKQSHPEITLEDAGRIREQYATEQGEPAPDLGLPLGNSQGQAQAPPVEKADSEPSHGAESTDT